MLRDYLKKIEQSGRQLQSLLNDILEMSRAESGKFELQLVPTDLCLCFEELDKMFRERMKGKHIRFTVYNSGVKKPFVWCDRKNLKQVLASIISNSFKYTPEGGTISASISETGSGENGYSSYEFRIQDSGAGMSAEFIDKVFNSSDGEPSAADTSPGETGLSLPVVKMIFEQMDGVIEVFSSPGNGTEIVLRVDFRLASEKDLKKEISIEKSSGK